MKLEQSFLTTKNNNPYWSSLICFNNAVIGKSYSKTEIGKTFNKVVEKGDYSRGDKDKIIEWLGKLTVAKKSNER